MQSQFTQIQSTSPRKNNLLRTRLTHAVLAVASLGALAGCGTEPPRPDERVAPIDRAPVLPVPGSRSAMGGGAVLMAASFSGLPVGADQQCRWRMINQQTRESFFVDVKSNQPFTYAKLEPGTYQTGRFGCGLTRVWDIDSVFKNGFKVLPGETSYVGKLDFQFQGEELEVVNKGTRRESAGAFENAVHGTPAGNSTVVSGFTEKPITPAMVQGELLDGFDVFAKGISDAKNNLSPLLNTLQACAKTDATNDPLRLGQLQYVALYKDGRFSEMKDRQEANTFSDQLRSCVERGLMSFHPVAKKEIEVRVRY